METVFAGGFGYHASGLNSFVCNACGITDVFMDQARAMVNDLIFAAVIRRLSGPVAASSICRTGSGVRKESKARASNPGSKPYGKMLALNQIDKRVHVIG